MISEYTTTYKKTYVSIKMNNKLYLKSKSGTEEMVVLGVIINNKNNKKINMGNYYIQLDKKINNNILKEISKQLIENIDYITYSNYRYIGKFSNGTFETNNSVISLLKEKNISKKEKEIRDIYNEFIRLKKGTKEYKKYSSFLEITYLGKQINDLIIGDFLHKKRKSILDYDDISEEIKKTFSNNVFDTTGSFNYEKNMDKLNELKEKIKLIDEEISCVENLLKESLEVISYNEENNKLNELIKELKKTKLFDKKRKTIKNQIKNIKDNNININIEEKINLLKTKLQEKLDISCSNYALDEIYDLLKKEKDNYNDKRENIIKEYDEIYEKLEEYENNKIDISDLYERIENSM